MKTCGELCVKSARIFSEIMWNTWSNTCREKCVKNAWMFVPLFSPRVSARKTAVNNPRKIHAKSTHVFTHLFGEVFTQPFLGFTCQRILSDISVQICV